MTVPGELLTYLADLQQEVLSRAELEGDEAMRRDAFSEIVTEILAEAGEVEDAQICYHRAHGIEVGGYHYAADDGVLDLFLPIFHGGNDLTTLQRTECDTAFRRLTAFFKRAYGDYYVGLEEASPAFDMAQQIHVARLDIREVRLFVISDAVAPTYDRVAEVDEGVRFSFAVWDLARLSRLEASGRRQEPVDVDFEDRDVFGGPIPCLAAPNSHAEFKTYLMILPASVLGRLYARYRDRLLELNVRSFLQSRGKVNKGIRQTINGEPQRFLAYNNGITATAESVELAPLSDGGLAIARVKNLQVVNGGQTTASIDHALTRDGAELDEMYVPAKLVVVPHDKLLSIVPLISRYSNSQNKIQEADFAANEEFHVTLEKLSRTVWAPSAEGTNRQTRWFYERARGAYQVAVAAAGTPSKQRQFKTENPLDQKFTKTDLAKYANAWDQLPHVVSLGAQKCFRELTLRLAQGAKVAPDEQYFHRLIAKAILWRKVEREVGSLELGGYRANVVAYTIAFMSHRTAQRLDLELIWRSQGVGEGIVQAVGFLAPRIYQTLISEARGRNVTEWCKKPACWESVRGKDWALPSDLPVMAAPDHRETSSSEEPGGVEQAVVDLDELHAVEEVTAPKWFELSNWGKVTEALQPWQRRLAFGLGRLVRSGHRLTAKQVHQGFRIIQIAKERGFPLKQE